MVEESERLRRKALQRQRWEFVRTHHPDVGGDPAVFADGIRRFDALLEGRSTSPPPRVIGVAHTSAIARLMQFVRRLLVRDRPPPRVR